MPSFKGLICTVLALAFGSAWGADSHQAEERRSLESARYLYEIEGDRNRAVSMLERLTGSRDPAVRAGALYLQGRILEQEGRHDSAAVLYAAALPEPGLSQMQRVWIVNRLREISPGTLRPFAAAGAMTGSPARILADGDGYILPESGTQRLYRQNERGELSQIGPLPGGDEELLDATGARMLTRSIPRQRIYLRRGPASAPVSVQERFIAEEGHIFEGDADELLLIGSHEARLVREGRVVFSHALPGAGCTWHAASPRARQGILFCPGRALFRADFRTPAVAQLPVDGEVPVEVLVSGDYLAMRHGEHLEIRRGPAFESILWGTPASLQDAVALGRNLFFAADGEGVLRALSLRTGRLAWRRDIGAEAVHAREDETFVLTYARTLVALDPGGNDLFEYEAGWEDEPPLLLPSRDWLVLHGRDGRRTRLDLELLRIAGSDRRYLLETAQASVRAGDPRRALAELDELLALEPGNGLAWREKARLLESLDADTTRRKQAWTQTARSRSAEPWSTDPAFDRLAASLDASWVWKRRPGPRFFPVPTGGERFSFYVENDNSTLIVLDNLTGRRVGGHRFREPLDLKVFAWAGDTMIVSGSGNLYLLPPPWNGRETEVVAMRDPLCHAIMVPEGLLYSDWNGHLHLLDPATMTHVWQVRLARGGLLLAAGGNPGSIDVFEIDGEYHRVDLRNGQALASVRLPGGTITEVHSGPDFSYAGYNEGFVLAVNRGTGTVAWRRDLGEQIFSMSGHGDESLLLGTASQRLLHIAGRTGLVRAQARMPVYLFNRPLLTSNGYWIGTTAPALEKRSMNHELLQTLPLPGMPGTPAKVGNGVAVSTLDNFIIRFPRE